MTHTDTHTPATQYLVKTSTGTDYARVEQWQGGLDAAGREASRLGGYVIQLDENLCPVRDLPPVLDFRPAWWRMSHGSGLVHHLNPSTGAAWCNRGYLAPGEGDLWWHLQRGPVPIDAKHCPRCDAKSAAEVESQDSEVVPVDDAWPALEIDGQGGEVVPVEAEDDTAPIPGGVDWITSLEPSEYARDQHRCLPGLDAPEEFEGDPVIAAVRCPVDVSTYPRRHVIVVKHTTGGWQTFSTHEVAHDHSKWVGGQGHYDLTWREALADMVKRAS
jgi:hypothetical protein